MTIAEIAKQLGVDPVQILSVHERETDISLIVDYGIAGGKHVIIPRREQKDEPQKSKAVATKAAAQLIEEKGLYLPAIVAWAEKQKIGLRDVKAYMKARGLS